MPGTGAETAADEPPAAPSEAIPSQASPARRVRVPLAAWLFVLAAAFLIFLIFRGSETVTDDGEPGTPRSESPGTVRVPYFARTPVVHGPRDSTFLAGPIDSFDIDALDRLCPYRRGSFICYSRRVEGEKEFATYLFHAKHTNFKTLGTALEPKTPDLPPGRLTVGGSGFVMPFLDLRSFDAQTPLTSHLRDGKSYEYEIGEEPKPFQPVVVFEDSHCRAVRLEIRRARLTPSARQGSPGRAELLHVDLEGKCASTSSDPASTFVGRYCVGCDLSSPEIKSPRRRIAEAGHPLADLDSLDKYCPETPGEKSICVAMQNHVDGAIEVASSTSAPENFGIRYVNGVYYAISNKAVSLHLQHPYRQNFTTGLRYRYNPLAPGEESQLSMPEVTYRECEDSMVDELNVLRWVDNGLDGWEAHVTFLVDCANYRHLVGRFQHSGR